MSCCLMGGVIREGLMMKQSNRLLGDIENKEQLISGVQIIDRTIVWFTPLILILVVTVIFRSIRHGAMGVSLIQSVFLMMVWIAALTSRFTRPVWRLYVYILAMSVNGVLGMDRWGLLGTSQISIILSFLLSSMLGLRRWLVIMSLNLLLIAVVAGSWVLGGRPLTFDPVTLMHSGSAWAMMMMALGAMGAASLVWVRINRHLLLTVKQLADSEQTYRDILNATSDALFIHDETGTILDGNGAARALFGLGDDAVDRYSIKDLSGDPNPDSEAVVRERLRLAFHEGPQVFEWKGRRLDGTVFWSEVALNASSIGGKPRLLASVRDITDRKEAEEEKIRLENSLRQSQKMEAVGRLAGGVAHDFNNMLGVILGFTDMALERIEPGDALADDLREIRTAAERSANLTRQLLMFARKQIIAPRVLDLNRTVDGMLKILTRLIGEHIDLVWLPGMDLWPVKIDPTQVDQVLTNLCVNARDAIGNVGHMTIETRNITFDEAYCLDHAGFVAGDYVLLAVSDDGSGMDRHTLDNLFEPFFTTKGAAHGSGLGLATLYGIVKQNKGFINVYSEVGFGSTFKIYLPRDRGSCEGRAEPSIGTAEARGHETILLVEDEIAIMNMAAAMLEKAGYRVMAAPRPTQAIRMARAVTDAIDLLITDVVMPEMNGRELADNLLSHHPGLAVLFMSGYTADVIAHHGVLDEGVHFIEKPFSKQHLLLKVRSILS
jgi:PAS domain S-box-containing protein